MRRIRGVGLRQFAVPARGRPAGGRHRVRPGEVERVAGLDPRVADGAPQVVPDWGSRGPPPKPGFRIRTFPVSSFLSRTTPPENLARGQRTGRRRALAPRIDWRVRRAPRVRRTRKGFRATGNPKEVTVLAGGRLLIPRRPRQLPLATERAELTRQGHVSEWPIPRPAAVSPKRSVRARPG